MSSRGFRRSSLRWPSQAAFNFNPLMQSSRRSIEPSLHGYSELLGCWDESALQIEAMPVVAAVAARPERWPYRRRHDRLWSSNGPVFLVAAV